MVKKVLYVLGTMAAVIAMVLYFFGEEFKQAAYDKLTEDMYVSEDADDFDPGPPVGSAFPAVAASYKGRSISSLEEFYGPNGLAFVATRSADWCPYCMKQMIQLQEHKAEFDAAGIGLLAITYDDPVLQQAFIDKWRIEYPMLHDLQAETFMTLGILNAEYEPGDSSYGIPHPGMIVVDSEGNIAGKLFLEAYSTRVDAVASLAYAKEMLGLE